jgi:hypothetical protein
MTSIQTSAVQPPPWRPVSTGECGASPEARLLALIVQNQLVQGESAQTSVTLSQEQLKQIREAVREALEEAREANDKSGFWGSISDVLGGDLATLAEVVVVAAAAVATGGAAALVLGAITVGCSLASKYADELGIPPKVAIGIGIAAAIASVASGNIAGSGSAGALTNASTSAASAAGEASQVSRLTQVAEEVRFYSSLVAPTAKGSGAIAGLVSGYYGSEALHDNASAHAGQSREKLTSMDIDFAIDLLGIAVDRQLSAMAETNHALQANQQSELLIIHSFQGVA